MKTDPQFIPRSDLVLFVTSPTGPSPRASAFLGTFAPGQKVVVVLNKVDLFRSDHDLRRRWHLSAGIVGCWASSR
jgi:tRNA U34 5-carboxymethylaminomethyl modifying GTPase MnmE/TrmE